MSFSEPSQEQQLQLLWEDICSDIKGMEVEENNELVFGQDLPGSITVGMMYIKQIQLADIGLSLQ